jgi:hypothetical protein
MTNSDSSPQIDRPEVIVCADWSKGHGKRSVYVARVGERTIRRVAGRKWSFGKVMGLAAEEQQRGPVLVAFDVTLGVPSSYFKAAQEVESWVSAHNFIDWLAFAAATPNFFAAVGAASEWSVRRPYFTVPAGKGSYGAFERAAKSHGVNLKRQIDTLTGGKSAFAIGIPGHVAPAAQTLWEELAAALAPERSFSIWPFEGTLAALFHSKRIVVGEIYPRAAYTTALANQLPDRLRALKKTKCSVRHGALKALESADWVRRPEVTVNGFEPAWDSEDDFDALMTSAAMLRYAIEGLSFSVSTYEDPVAEGGILGTGTLTF